MLNWSLLAKRRLKLRFTNIAAKADIWLQLRPATDAALVLGMLNHIIEKKLYDREFVDKYCFGFEQLRERVQKYPLKRVSEITWIPEADIRQAATMYATVKPAVLHTFMGPAMQVNAMQALRAINLLPALTGNVDVKCGNLLPNPYNRGVTYAQLDIMCRLPKEVMIKAPGPERWPMFYG